MIWKSKREIERALDDAGPDDSNETLLGFIHPNETLTDQDGRAVDRAILGIPFDVWSDWDESTPEVRK